MPQTAEPIRFQKYATVEDIAEAYDVCPKTVMNWVKEGKLPPPDDRKSARTLRWSPAAYASFLTFA